MHLLVIFWCYVTVKNDSGTLSQQPCECIILLYVVKHYPGRLRTVIVLLDALNSPQVMPLEDISFNLYSKIINPPCPRSIPPKTASCDQCDYNSSNAISSSKISPFYAPYISGNYKVSDGQKATNTLNIKDNLHYLHNLIHTNAGDNLASLAAK